MENINVAQVQKESLEALQESYFRILNQESYCDFKLFVGKDQQIFNVHRAIISNGSDYFASLCKDSFKEGYDSTARLPLIEPNIMRHVLVWLYTGSTEMRAYPYLSPRIEANMEAEGLKPTKLVLPELEPASEIYVAAQYLGIIGLRQIMLNYMIWVLDNKLPRSNTNDECVYEGEDLEILTGCIVKVLTHTSEEERKTGPLSAGYDGFIRVAAAGGRIRALFATEKFCDLVHTDPETFLNFAKGVCSEYEVYENRFEGLEGTVAFMYQGNKSR